MWRTFAYIKKKKRKKKESILTCDGENKRSCNGGENTDAWQNKALCSDGPQWGCCLTACVEMDEWQQHDSNGNPILEYQCVQFHGIAQSLPKSTIYFPTILDFTGRKFYIVIRQSFHFPGSLLYIIPNKTFQFVHSSVFISLCIKDKSAGTVLSKLLWTSQIQLNMTSQD